MPTADPSPESLSVDVTLRGVCRYCTAAVLNEDGGGWVHLDDDGTEC